MRFLFLCAILLSSCGSLDRKKEKKMAAQEIFRTGTDINHESVSRLIQNWPEAAKASANDMITRYGLPQEVTASSLLWEENAPFKRTKVFRQEIPHSFPYPHSDVLEQTVNYKMGASKVEKIWRFNGSVSLDRTKGEMTSRCDKQQTNVLALNLADEIIAGT